MKIYNTKNITNFEYNTTWNKIEIKYWYWLQ